MHLFKNKFSVLFFIATLFFTLRSYYFYSISLAPGPLLGAMLLFVLGVSYSCKVNEEELKFIGTLILIFTFSSLNALLSGDPYINSILGLIVNLGVFYLLIATKQKVYESLYVLNYVFTIHVIFFLIQFFAYYFFNEKIDFLEPITGEVQRMSGFERIADHGGLAIFRPSGLFSEPSSYCVFMITLLWVAKKSGFLSFKVEILTILSILFSFSLSGIIFALLYLGLNYFGRLKIRHAVVFTLLSLLLVYLSSDYIISYYNYRVANLATDNSTNERLLMFTLFSELSVATQLFGSGVGNDIVNIPLTTIPSLLIYLGVIGTSVFIVYIFLLFSYFKVSYSSCIFLLFITFNFYKISNPYVWFFITLLLVTSRVIYDQRKKTIITKISS